MFGQTADYPIIIELLVYEVCINGYTITQAQLCKSIQGGMVIFIGRVQILTGHTMYCHGELPLGINDSN